MSKRVLLIDCQVFQSPAWDRGMGKYSLNLLRSFFEMNSDTYQEIELIYNSKLPLNKEIERILDKTCPKTKKVFLDLSIPSKHKEFSELRQVNKNILDAYISKYSDTISIDFLILSLFIDEACIVFPNRGNKLLIFYDLIPHLYFLRYRKRIRFDIYLTHFKTIFEADLIFTISQTVADDVAMYLGIQHKKLINIGGASIDRSSHKSTEPVYAIPPMFILMPSGDELRKNNLQAVRGFEEFNSTQGNKYSLVLTSTFSEDTKKELSSYCDNLIFTGNTSESNLRWLYENAELVLFASEYEGLGLPVLEAVGAGVKVACSDIPSFKEMSAEAFYFFEQYDSSSIALTIRQALDEEDWSNRKNLYPSIKKRFNWHRTGKIFLEALNAMPDYEWISKKADNNKRLAVFTPHVAGYSSVGKGVAALHSSLSEFFNVDYYFDYGKSHREVRTDYLSYIANCYDAAEFSAKRYKDYDAVLYHIGNSEYHLETIKNATYLPGYTIVHDTHLNGVFNNLVESRYITNERVELEKLLDKGNKTSTFLTTILNDQVGIITHSKFARKASESVIIDPGILHTTVNLPTGTPRYLPKRPKQKEVYVGLAGILADVKGLAIMESLATNPLLSNAKFYIFGHIFGDLESLNKLKSYENVVVHPNPTDFEFQSELAKMDILINYRLEYRGETSSSAIEAMRYGVAVIVRDIGWYAEQPDDVVVKVTNEDDVIKAVELLVADVEGRQRIGANAYKYIKDKFSYLEYASKIANLIDAGSKSKSMNAVLSNKYRATGISKSSMKNFFARLIDS